MPCVKSITEQWLKERGYHGLVSNNDCGCGTADLMPCNEPGVGCAAAIEVAPARIHIDGYDECRWLEPEWFDPKEKLPVPRKGEKVVECWVRLKVGSMAPKIEEVMALFRLVASGRDYRWSAEGDWKEVLSWRYDLPPGSWREGEDQSRLPSKKGG